MTLNVPHEVIRVRQPRRRVASFITHNALDIGESGKDYRMDRLKLANVQREKLVRSSSLGRERALQTGYIEFIKSLLSELAKVENAELAVQWNGKAASRTKFGRSVADLKREVAEYLRSCL